jgi:hypothetical protein
MLTFDSHWLAGEVYSSQMNPGFNSTGRQCVWRRVGEQLPDVNSGGGVMVWADENNDILLMAILMHRDTLTRSHLHLHLSHLADALIQSDLQITHVWNALD